MTHRRTRRAFVTASDAGNRLVIAAEVDNTDETARTITGLVVPFGAAGHTSGGRLIFSAGSLTWTDPRRVKLLREHDQRDVIGFATELTETDAGLVATFAIPAGENGDRALAEASNGLRDAFSVGVQLDDATLTRLRRAQNAPVAAAGALREVSQVSVPAYDDARVAASADLVVSAWTTATTTTSSTTAGTAGTTREETRMTPEQIARLAALRAQQSLTQAEAGELSQLAALELSTAGTTGTTTAAGTTGTAPQQPATASAGSSAAGPAVVPAVAGAALVTSEPATYTFSGDGPSIVRDLFNSAMRNDSEATERVARFNAELSGNNPASVASFVSAAATRDDYDGAGSEVPEVLAPSPRPILREAIDVNRPIISRLDRIPISNAQPFAVPAVEAEFDGVGAHTEGTPHRPAGSLTLSGGGVVQPTATSGAWEVSRELVDASNPAIDRIAARAMLRDYQRKSNAKMDTLLAARAAQEGSTIYGIDTALALRDALVDFVNDDDEAADLVGLSKSLLRSILNDVDATDRPQIPFVGPANALGTSRAGYTGVAIDGTEMFRAARFDTVLGAGSGLIARSDGLLWAESSVLQFRFDEVLGPGVIKLALWAYSGAAIIDVDDVKILRAGADPTP